MNSPDNPYRKDYSFLEYLAANETEVCGGDFNQIDPKWMVYYEGFLKSVGVAMATKHKSVHDGDCIKQPHTCTLCLIWDELNDYNNYIFHHDVWLYGTQPDKTTNLPTPCNHDEILKASGKMAIAASRVVRSSMVDLYPAVVELEHAMNIYDNLIISRLKD